MLTFLVVAHVIIAVFLGIVVLLQPGKGGGLVMGGTSQTLFGATGAGNFFTKLTTVLVLLLVVTSIALTKAQNKNSRSSLFDSSTAPAGAPAPIAPTAPAGAATSAPQAPAAAAAPAQNAPAPVEAAPADNK